MVRGPQVQHCHIEDYTRYAYGENGRVAVASSTTQIPHIVRRTLGQAKGISKNEDYFDIYGQCLDKAVAYMDYQRKDILALEGLIGPHRELGDIQKAFIDETAVHSGSHTSGYIPTAKEILDTRVDRTDDAPRKLLSGHLCRCTGHENILRAVEKAMLQRLGKSAD